MPSAVCDGIETRYELLGDGPPLLLFSPGGFDATIEHWREFSIYRRLGLLDHLSRSFACIAFDKRESGRSGGRVEVLTWEAYAAQGLALLDHLGIERTHLMGGCIGCSIAATLAVAHPERVEKLVLYSPAGGPRYRMRQHARFAEHAAHVREHGLPSVVELARTGEESFADDPRLGPWVSVLRVDPAFASAYAARDPAGYLAVVERTARGLFDRDTVPGLDPEQLLQLRTPALIAPGDDASHALSAAHYLRECLPQAELWDVPPAEQTAENAPQRVVEFLQQ
jgi:pimeloyl-ACP methyl ester carboxylesterase